MSFAIIASHVPRAARLGLAGLFIALTGVAASAQSDREMRCAQLEQELANAWQGDSGESDIGRIEAEIRQVERQYQQGEAQAERAGCYENFFIFGRGLVRTPRCLRMHNQIENARRQLSRLQQQRNAGRGGSNRRRDYITDTLAREGCGSQYQQQARREPRGFFEELFGGFEPDPMPRRDGWTTSRIDPTMPYRTLCVRECDGFYYPISYSVMPSAFGSQQAQCQSQCAAPADLYVYPNPGGQVEQAVSLDGRAYMDHVNAFKYRKEYVKGCSCKTAEYNPSEIEGADKDKKKAETEGDEPLPWREGSANPAEDQAPKQAETPGPESQPVARQDEAEPADPIETGSIEPAQAEPVPDLPPALQSAAPVRRPAQAAPVKAAPVQASAARRASEAPPRR